MMTIHDMTAPEGDYKPSPDDAPVTTPSPTPADIDTVIENIKERVYRLYTDMNLFCVERVREFDTASDDEREALVNSCSPIPYIMTDATMFLDLEWHGLAHFLADVRTLITTHASDSSSLKMWGDLVMFAIQSGITHAMMYLSTGKVPMYVSTDGTISTPYPLERTQ